MASSKLMIEVNANTKKAVKELNDVNKSLAGVSKTIDSSTFKFNQVADAWGHISAAGRSILNMSKEFVQFYSVQQRAETLLASTIKATGTASTFTTRELKKMASGFQGISTYGDEAVLGVQSLYIATKKIGNEIMPRATQAALDMSAALGQDLTGNALKLARVLADPTQGLDSLKESNITLTKAQRDEIAALAEQGDLLAAQEKILEAVEGAYGGIAKSIADTDTGKLQQIANVWGDIKEGLGDALVDSIGPALDVTLKLLNGVSDALGEWNEDKEISVTLKVDGKKADLSSFSTEALQKQIAIYTAATLRGDMGYVNPALRIGAPASSAAGSGMASPIPEGNVEAESYLEAIRAELGRRMPKRKDSHGDIYAVGFGEGEGTPIVQTIEEEAAGAEEVALTVEDLILKYDRTAAAIHRLEEANKELLKGQEGLAESSDEYKDLQALIDQNNADIEALQAPGPTAEELARSKAEEYIAGVDSVENSIKALEEENAMLEKLCVEGKLTGDLLDQMHAAMDANDQKIKELQDGPGVDSSLLGKSKLYKMQGIDRSLSEVRAAHATTTDEGQKAIYEEVIKALEEEKRLLSGIKTDSEKLAELYDEIASQVSLWGDAIGGLTNDLFGFADQLVQNDIDALEHELSEMEKLYDDYFDSVNGKYAKARDNLDLYYHTGQMSAEEYYQRVQSLEEEESAARQKKKEEEEALADELNELKERQFHADQANAIVQATIAAAQSIANIWGVHGANPVLAGVLTGISAAATGAQIATIASQQYTPMANGGIVTRPIHALVGENGPEMILPVTDENLRKTGMLADSSSSGGTTIINITNAYGIDNLARQLVDAIIKGQRMGTLPKIA